jgi:TonB family protein
MQRQTPVAPAISRFLAFIGASIALHALTLGACTGAGSMRAAYRAPSERALRAVLTPLQITESQRNDVTDSPVDTHQGVPEPSSYMQTESFADESGALASESPAGEGAGLDLLLLDKWYTAGELDTRAEPLDSVKLAYPQNLAVGRIGGRVQIALFIDEVGMVRKAKIVASHPERMFDDEALKGWEEIRFSPALKDGQPVKSEKLLEIDFIPN